MLATQLHDALDLNRHLDLDDTLNRHWHLDLHFDDALDLHHTLDLHFDLPNDLHRHLHALYLTHYLGCLDCLLHNYRLFDLNRHLHHPLHLHLPLHIDRYLQLPYPALRFTNTLLHPPQPSF